MMAKTEYREKWLKKLEGYKNDGLVIFTEAKPEDGKILIVNEVNPKGGTNSQAI